ncbi:MAG: hypothetical protein JWL88_42 [Parcubacteria group bacterium]|nr:hypothetical protein [Parcubacteria group bacterium]
MIAWPFRRPAVIYLVTIGENMNTMTLDRTHEIEQKPHIAGSVRDIKKFILDRNREQSDLFCNANARLARKQYRKLHPTKIIAKKCMDGRLNLSVWTETPVGIVNPFRNIGGKFDFGWPWLAELMKQEVNDATLNGSDVLIMMTYHYSKGDHHRGCAGFNYDTESARAGATALVAQAGRIYGRPYQVVHPILVGMETDDEALVFHSEAGETFAVADNLELSAHQLEQRFMELYPEMRERIRIDLLELVKGNQSHIKKIRAAKRMPIDLNHREQVIGVGRGFDWLHLPNMALIIGPYSLDWPSAVATAGKILLGNLKEGRIDPDAGRMLLIAKLSRDEFGSHGWNAAKEEAHFVTDTAYDSLKSTVPELLDENFCVLTGVVDAQTRLLHLCD